jgi:hypothetical protein
MNRLFPDEIKRAVRASTSSPAAAGERRRSAFNLISRNQVEAIATFVLLINLNSTLNICERRHDMISAKKAKPYPLQDTASGSSPSKMTTSFLQEGP